MANLSESVGAIYIRVKTESEAVFMVVAGIIDKALCYNDYQTWLDSATADDIECEDGWSSESLGFSGTGRWAYADTVKNYRKWLQNSTVITDAEKKFLEDLEFEIEYEFADLVEGLGIFYKAVIKVTCGAGVPLSGASCETISMEDLAMTAENLCNAGLYDEGDVMDMNMPRVEAERWLLKECPEDKDAILAVFYDDDAYAMAKKDLCGQLFWKNEDPGVDWSRYLR